MKKNYILGIALLSFSVAVQAEENAVTYKDSKAQVRHVSGGTAGDYYPVAKRMEQDVQTALVQLWSEDIVEAVTTPGSTFNVKTILADKKAFGFIQGNLELKPGLTHVNTKMVQTILNESAILVVNPWIAKRVPDYKKNRNALLKVVLTNGDKLKPYGRDSGHLVTFNQVKAGANFPDALLEDQNGDKLTNTLEVLDAVAADNRGITVLTQFGRADNPVFKEITKRGLIILPLVTPGMKHIMVNGRQAFTMCPNVKVGSSFDGGTLTINTACTSLKLVRNSDAPEELVKVLDALDYAKYKPTEGFWSKAKSKIGDSTQGAQNLTNKTLQDISEAMEKLPEIKL